MMARILKSMLAAALLAWGVHDLGGGLALALLAACLPLALGVSNLVPFATMALPVLVAAVAVALRVWPDVDLGAAAQSMRQNADQVRRVLAQQLPPN